MRTIAKTSSTTFGMLVDTVKTFLVALFIFGSTSVAFAQQCEFQPGNPPADQVQEICFYKFNVNQFELMGCLQCQITGGQIKCGNGVIAAAGYANYDMISYAGSQCFNAVVLPVELKEFNYNKNFFTWITASESNNNYFTIEKSFDMENWFEIAQVDSKVNSSTSDTRYQYEYENNDQATVYFRLSQVDFDGTKVSFDAISVTNSKKGNAYPNPSNTGKFQLQDVENNIEIKVCDLNGNIVETLQGNQYTLDLSTQMNGVYMIIYTQSNGSVNYERLIINK
jgi:hypothetical protein